MLYHGLKRSRKGTIAGRKEGLQRIEAGIGEGISSVPEKVGVKFEKFYTCHHGQLTQDESDKTDLRSCHFTRSHADHVTLILGQLAKQTRVTLFL